MSKFEVGQRVAVYGDAFNLWCDGYYATVEKVYDSGDKLRVICDDIATDKREDHVHPKQCRLLKKKQRRRVWVRYNDAGGFEGYSTVGPDAWKQCEKQGWTTVCFIEKRRGSK